jgi:hypothetical protein
VRESSVEPHRWGERAIALAAVALALVVLFGPAIFADRLFAMRDAGHYYYPLFKWCADTWGTGQLPLWNPLENCGTAIHADPTASIWYPGKLVFALPLDFSINYKLYIVGHVVLCAITAYWLARKWGGSRYAAALAALSYACGGSVVFQHANVVYLVGAAWLAVAAGLIDDILRQQRIASAVWLGVVLAMLVLGGDPQMAYHVLLVAVIYATVVLARRIPAFELRRQARRSAVWGGGLVAVGAAIAFCLAAIQILPSASAARQIERAHYDQPRNLYESADYLYSAKQDPRPTLERLKEVRAGLLGVPTADTHHASIYDYSVAPWRLAEFVWPNIGGRMFPTHRRWFSLLPDESRIWTPTLYMGLLPLVLGLSVFSLRSDDLRIRWLSWTTLIFVLGSLGSFGVGWLVRHAVTSTTGANSPIGDGVGGVYWLLVVFLPKYVLFRYPAKLMVVAALGISQLVAIGWDRALTERTPSQPPRRVGWALTVLGIASGVGAFVALVASQFIVLGAGNVDPVFGPFDNSGAWIDIVSALVQTSIVSLACAGLLGLASGGRQPPEATRPNLPFTAPILLAVCTVELTLANYWLVPTAPAHLWRERSAVAEAIGEASEPPRLYRDVIAWPHGFSTRGSPQRLEELVRWERDTLAGRYGLLDGIAVVNSQVGVLANDHARLLDQLQSTDQVSRKEAFETLGVDYLLTSHDDPLTAERVAIDDLPQGVQLLRHRAAVTRPAGPTESDRKNPAFNRGAWISGVSWGVLFAGFAVWLWRRPAGLKSLTA